ncbi:ECF transporter, substrate-specific component [anaerobic digester metagenome]|jgi:ECF transporter S component (folate family)|nr:folate family ECF transporter S component [Clostridiaceae bacterium HFYG-1003]
MQNSENKRQVSRVREIVFMGIMIALDVLAVRFLSVETPVMRVGLGFLANIIAGMYLGPARAGIVGLLADLVGFFMFPKGTFFPGFTISAAVNGILAGYFLEGRKSANFKWFVSYAILSTLLVDTLMNTIWLVMMLHNGDMSFFWTRLSIRIPNQVVVTALKIIMVPLLYNTVFKRLRAVGVERPGIREGSAKSIN